MPNVFMLHLTFSFFYTTKADDSMPSVQCVYVANRL